MTLSKKERVQIAAKLLEKSPPGQTSDVFKDIRQLINDDEALDAGIQKALIKYNTEQLICTRLTDKKEEHDVLISIFGAIDDHTYLDPKTQKSFVFDHFTLKTSNVTPYKINEGAESTRKVLETAVLAYVDDHYAKGVAAVYSPKLTKKAEFVQDETNTNDVNEGIEKENEDKPKDTVTDTNGDELKIEDYEQAPQELENINESTDSKGKSEQKESKEEINPGPPSQATIEDVDNTSPVYHIAIVDNLYNFNNFWTGRWRSIWTIDSSTGEVQGTIYVNVHYYEDGNVQLNATKTIEPIKVSITDSKILASSAVKFISDSEQKYQTSLNAAYMDLSEQTFKGLRRTLPLTKQKVDWSKITSYKLGAQLSKAA